MKCMLCELANSLSSKRMIKLVKIVKQQLIKVSRNWPEDRQQTEKHLFKNFYRVSVRTVVICDIWARNCSHHLSPTSYYIFQKVFFWLDKAKKRLATFSSTPQLLLSYKAMVSLGVVGPP